MSYRRGIKKSKYRVTNGGCGLTQFTSPFLAYRPIKPRLWAFYCLSRTLAPGARQV